MIRLFSFRRNRMFSHVTVGTNDLAKAGAFYDAVFEALGMSRGFEGRPSFPMARDRVDGSS